MTSVDRDMQVVSLVAQFRAMTARQIRGVLFASNLSNTPCDRVLRRLLAQRYLARFKWRFQPAARHGSAEYVYQLGINGWRFIGYESVYKKLEAYERHQLAIGDLFVRLKALEQAGLIQVEEPETEPNNWERIGHIELRPDLYAKIRTHHDGLAQRYWFETDLGTEHREQIRDKVRRYRAARDTASLDDPRWQGIDASGNKVVRFPLVMFVVQTADGQEQDLKRKTQLEQWLGSDHNGLFTVATTDELERVLTA